MGTIDSKKLFETENSQIAMRDRADYSGRFDAMPPGLQQWWVDRAARFALSTHTNGDRQRQEEAARRALDDPEIKRAVHRKPQARS